MKSITTCIVEAVKKDMEGQYCKAITNDENIGCVAAEQVRIADGKILSVVATRYDNHWEVLATVTGFGVERANSANCTTYHCETNAPVIKWGIVCEVIRDTIAGYVRNW